jgi:RNA polymerase sigma-70 factor (ECF subfamily)
MGAARSVRLPFAEVALRGGRTPAAVRQLAARARRHVFRRGAPRLHVNTAEHQATFRVFIAAAAGEDLGALVAVLDPDVVLTAWR